MLLEDKTFARLCFIFYVYVAMWRNAGESRRTKKRAGGNSEKGGRGRRGKTTGQEQSNVEVCTIPPRYIVILSL